MGTDYHWPKNFRYAVYTINGSISIAACVISITVFVISRVLRKPPGFLIFWQIVWQFVISTVWVIQGLNGLDTITEE
jgi:hypothetical protein